MSEVKDPAIKLFGKTICLFRDDSLSCCIAADQPAKRSRSSITTTSHDNKTSGEVSESKEDDECTNLSSAEGAVTSCDDDKTQKPDKETQSVKDVKKDDESETNSDSRDEKSLKKPDKILGCPRCNSRDTKFCYYNNYNVNQPRYFCKNCQRYWTAGGSMRNVPVGSGRRKNKASASNFRHIMVSEALKPNGTVLTFGSENRAVNEPMVSVLNCVSNQRIPALYGVLGPWNARWISAPAASPDQSSPNSPKIQDPNEAAKSSIWSTLGIKHDKLHPPGTTLFTALNSKDDDRDRNHVAANSLVLQANPAAMSRSLNFQERT